MRKHSVYVAGRGGPLRKTYALAALLALSCVRAQPPPPEMTALQHRIEAAEHDNTARAEQAKFNPAATEPYQSRSEIDPLPAGAKIVYNPTVAHLAAADAEMRAAAAHVAAAERLEAFENVACMDIPRAERAACPLLASKVAQVRETAIGIELVFNPGVDSYDINRRLSCHLAYAEANGFARPSCPLFVRGIALRLVSEGVLELSGKTPEVVSELQRQARRIFVGAPAASPAVSANP
jgi:hypothetical protein